MDASSKTSVGPLGRCPWCQGRGEVSGLVAVMSDDGSAFEAEGCMSCGHSWWNNPPKSSLPEGSATVTCSAFDAHCVALREQRGARA